MTTPAWLTSLVDQRLALLEHALKVGELEPDVLLMTYLVEDPLITPQRAERTCDNPGCRKFCPDVTPFFTGVLVRSLRNGQPVNMVFGVCGDCKTQLEDAPSS